MYVYKIFLYFSRYVFIECSELYCCDNITDAARRLKRGVATTDSQLMRTFCHIMMFGSLNYPLAWRRRPTDIPQAR